MIYRAVFILLFALILPINLLFGEELDRDVILEKAKLQFLWKNYESAERMARLVLQEEPENIDALMILAQVEYLKGRFLEAKATFEKILSKEGLVSGSLLRDYAIVQKASGDLAGAKTSFEKYLKNNPDDSLAIYHLSDLYFKLGEYDRAEGEIKKVYSRRDEQFIPSAILLSDIYLAQGKREEAEGVLKLLENERMSQLSEQIVSGLLGRIAVRREQYKKLSLNLYIGAGFDSNGLYQTEAEKRNSEEKISATKSFFYELNAEITYNPIISATKRLYIDFDIMKGFYLSDEVSQYDRLTLKADLGYKFFVDNKRKTLLNTGYRYYNIFFNGGERVGFKSFDTYVQSNGLFGELNHRFGKMTGIARYEFSFDEYHFHDKSGFRHELLFASSFAFGQGSFYLGPIFSLYDARLNQYDYYSLGATAGLDMGVFRDLRLLLSSVYEHREYFDNIKDRSDDLFLASLRFEYAITKSLYVNLLLSYLRLNSSLDIYSYDKYVTTLNAGFYY